MNNKVIISIISLPENFHKNRTISAYSLLNESGYFELFEIIYEDDIYEELYQHQQYIEQWLIWSEDKRTDAGWYIRKEDWGGYIVGHLSTLRRFEIFKYTDVVRACAAFIKREIEEIRNN